MLESRRTNTDERRRAPQATATVLQQNTYTAPAQRSLVDRSTRQRFGSADNLDQIDSRSTPNLNEAFALETSDDSLGSNHRNYSNMIIQGFLHRYNYYAYCCGPDNKGLIMILF